MAFQIRSFMAHPVVECSLFLQYECLWPTSSAGHTALSGVDIRVRRGRDPRRIEIPSQPPNGPTARDDLLDR